VRHRQQILLLVLLARWSHPNPPEKEVGRNAEHDKVGKQNKFLPMKKLVLLPILLLFALAAFFSCTKDAQPPDAKNTNQSHILSMTKGEDGILNLTISVESAAGNVVEDRDGDCPLYEAMRFLEIENDPPECDDTRVYVDVKFRLIKMHKQTLARTALTQYQDISNVGGLNITWYPYSPLSDYWYAVEFDKCVRYNNPTIPDALEDLDKEFGYTIFGVTMDQALTLTHVTVPMLAASAKDRLDQTQTPTSCSRNARLMRSAR
jgi:hypothetical protein